MKQFTAVVIIFSALGHYVPVNSMNFLDTEVESYLDEPVISPLSSGRFPRRSPKKVCECPVGSNLSLYVDQSYHEILERILIVKEFDIEFINFAARVFSQALNDQEARGFVEEVLNELIKKQAASVDVFLIVQKTLVLARHSEDTLTQQIVSRIEDLVIIDMEINDAAESEWGVEKIVTRLAVLSRKIKAGNRDACGKGLKAIKSFFPNASGCTIVEHLGDGSAVENNIVQLMEALLDQHQRKILVIPAGSLNYFSEKSRMRLQKALKKASSGLNSAVVSPLKPFSRT